MAENSHQPPHTRSTAPDAPLPSIVAIPELPTESLRLLLDSRSLASTGKRTQLIARLSRAAASEGGSKAAKSKESSLSHTSDLVGDCDQAFNRRSQRNDGNDLEVYGVNLRPPAGDPPDSSVESEPLQPSVSDSDLSYESELLLHPTSDSDLEPPLPDSDSDLAPPPPQKRQKPIAPSRAASGTQRGRSSHKSVDKGHTSAHQSLTDRQSSGHRKSSDDRQRGNPRKSSGDRQRGHPRKSSGDRQRGTSGKSGDRQRGTSGKSGNRQRGTSGKSGDRQRGTSGKSGDRQRGTSSKSTLSKSTGDRPHLPAQAPAPAMVPAVALRPGHRHPPPPPKAPEARPEALEARHYRVTAIATIARGATTTVATTIAPAGATPSTVAWSAACHLSHDASATRLCEVSTWNFTACSHPHTRHPWALLPHTNRAGSSTHPDRSRMALRGSRHGTSTWAPGWLTTPRSPCR